MAQQFSGFSSRWKDSVSLHSAWRAASAITGAITLLSLAWVPLSCKASREHSEAGETGSVLSVRVSPSATSAAMAAKIPQNVFPFEADDYEVYSAVISDIPVRVTGSPILITNVIAHYPVIGETLERVIAINKPLFKAAQEATLRDFAEKFQTPREVLLQEKFELKRRYVLLDRPFEGLPRGIIYRRDRACILLGVNKGAKVFLSFSRIGFNPARTQAFLAYDISDGEGGAIFTTLLNKKHGKWVIVNEEVRATS
ncbi:MAG: hypothetical protein U0Z53_29635 [Blastocatellia bacterium]